MVYDQQDASFLDLDTSVHAPPDPTPPFVLHPADTGYLHPTAGSPARTVGAGLYGRT